MSAFGKPIVAVVAVPFFLTDRSRVLAQETMNSVRCSAPLLTIAVVNGTHPGVHEDTSDEEWIAKTFSHVEFRQQNNLAAAWNRGIVIGFDSGAEFVLIINLDIVLHPDAIDNLLAFAHAHPQELVWSGTEYRTREEFAAAELTQHSRPGVHYSCFMVGQRFCETVGLFDEQFEPAYFEDSDMNRRLALIGKHGLITTSAPFFHFHMGTFKSAIQSEAELPTLGQQIERITSENADRYIKKWGGEPAAEKFRTPYNR